MEKFKELLEKLQKLEIIQKSYDWVENLPNDIYAEYFKDNHTTLKDGLYSDKHRHYETSISVIKICGGLLGIRYITDLFSESSMIEDCFFTMEFFEMKEMQITSYVKV